MLGHEKPLQELKPIIKIEKLSQFGEYGKPNYKTKKIVHFLIYKDIYLQKDRN